MIEPRIDTTELETIKFDPEKVSECISHCKEELKGLGLSDSEIVVLNEHLDGIIERGLDKYFLKLDE